MRRDNLKGSTIDKKRNKLIILLGKKVIELPIAAKKNGKKSTKVYMAIYVPMAISWKPLKIRARDSQG